MSESRSGVTIKRARLVGSSESLEDDSGYVHMDDDFHESPAHGGPAKAADLRPKSFGEYVGQSALKENLHVYVNAAKQQNRQLEHVILHGPPGLGKTTIARIIAHELNVELFETRGPSIDRAGDLAGILTGLTPGSVLFIDEIHRLSIKVEEVLYSAMEDGHLDLIVGEGASARMVPMEIVPFTLVGATTRLSLLSKPLRERFGIQERLNFYEVSDLSEILIRAAGLLGIVIDQKAATEIARRARGTPRIANRLLKRVWDFALADKSQTITCEIADRVLAKQGIDRGGLDRVDRAMLRVVAEQYNGGPVGIEALAATLNEDRATLEEVYEPYLVHQLYLTRGPRGRSLTGKGVAHLRDAGEIAGDLQMTPSLFDEVESPDESASIAASAEVAADKPS